MSVIISNTSVHLFQLSAWEIFALSIISYILFKTIYRIYFHPLRSFPGPLVASVTDWNKFYYDWYLDGTHSLKIKEWHAQYGPIIRIAPNELHFSDASAYKGIYSHSDLAKEPAFYKFMTENSLVGQLNINKTKRRRRIFASYFTATSIRTHGQVGGILWEKANQLHDTLKALFQQNGSQITVNIIDIARCFSYDVIKELGLGSSNTLSTSAPDFKPPFVAANANITKRIRFVQQFPFLLNIAHAIPDIIMARLSPGLLAMKQERVSACTQTLIHTLLTSPVLTKKDVQRPTIQSQILSSIPTNPKLAISTNALGHELFDFLMAGTELPANAISFATYHLALNPSITAKLRSELAQFLHHENGIPSLSELETLLYLTAIIKESLRLSSLIPGRLPRVVPPEGITVSGITIPGNTVVSSSALMVHTNPLLFPEPEKFVPERWMNSGNGILDKFFVPFSVGRRDCIGQHLALAEMRMFISGLVVNWDFELVSENGEGKGTRWRDNIVACYEPAVRVSIWERRDGHLGGEDKEAQRYVGDE